MPAVRDEGICLRHWDWSETSQTVSLFGRSMGVIRGLAKGARRERGAFDGGIDLLARGEFGAIVKSGLELATLTDWELLETFPVLRERLPRNRAAFYAADLVQRMLAPADPHTGLYDAFIIFLQALGTPRRSTEEQSEQAPASESAEMALALLQFQWTLLRETGLQPALETAGAGDERAALWFDPLAGTFSASAPPRGWRVRRATVELLRHADGSLGLSGTTGAAAPSGTSAESADRANRLLAAYIRETIQCEPPTLKDLFGSLGVDSIRSVTRPI